MLTNRGHSLEIYGPTNTDDWNELHEILTKDDSLTEVYFHYAHYHQKKHSHLLPSLNNALNLKMVAIKGSTFSFSVPNTKYKGNGLGQLLEGLQDCPKLEDVRIRNINTTNNDLGWALVALADLVEKSTTLKKIEICYQKLECPEFRILCDALAKPGVSIELDCHLEVKFSRANLQVLKKALNSNKSFTVTSNVAALLADIKDSDSATVSEAGSSLGWDVLSGFMVVMGVAAVALAITVVGTGMTGLIIATAGIGAILVSMGIFAANHPVPCTDGLPYNPLTLGVTY